MPKDNKPKKSARPAELQVTIRTRTLTANSEEEAKAIENVLHMLGVKTSADVTYHAEDETVPIYTPPRQDPGETTELQERDAMREGAKADAQDLMKELYFRHTKQWEKAQEWGEGIEHGHGYSRDDIHITHTLTAEMIDEDEVKFTDTMRVELNDDYGSTEGAIYRNGWTMRTGATNGRNYNQLIHELTEAIIRHEIASDEIEQAGQQEAETQDAITHEISEWAGEARFRVDKLKEERQKEPIKKSNQATRRADWAKERDAGKIKVTL